MNYPGSDWWGSIAHDVSIFISHLDSLYAYSERCGASDRALQTKAEQPGESVRAVRRANHGWAASPSLSAAGFVSRLLDRDHRQRGPVDPYADASSRLVAQWKAGSSRARMACPQYRRLSIRGLWFRRVWRWERFSASYAARSPLIASRRFAGVRSTKA